MTREETKKNLIPLTQRSPEEAFSIRSKGGKAAAEKFRERKTFREDFINALSTGNTQASIIKAACEKAADGDTAMLKLIAELIGENGISKTADVTDAVKAEANDRDALLDALKGAG